MTREVQVEFTGLTHDHLMVSKQDFAQQQQQMNGINSPLTMTTTTTDEAINGASQDTGAASALSTIAILRRHPMYDSLVLVKRYRDCLNGYTLEFPTSDQKSATPAATAEQQNTHSTTMTKKDCCKTKLVSVYLDGDDPIYQSQERENSNALHTPEGEIVYVPMNGLLHRLDKYDKLGISIDSRVYAFAMGLKTAEKFLTLSSEKELQETPPI